MEFRPTPPFAIVTGTSSGIGLATARALLEGGWSVIGLARRAAPLEHAAYVHVAADLADAGRLRRLADEELAPRLGAAAPKRIGLVNNAAAAGTLAPLASCDPLELQRLLALNLTAPVFLAGWLLRQAPPAAALRLVEISSGAARAARPGLADYAITKAALKMAGEGFGLELDAAWPERDACWLRYEPGLVATEMQDAIERAPAGSFLSADAFRQWREEGRMRPPEDPAREIVAFLEGDGWPRHAARRFGETDEIR